MRVLIFGSSLCRYLKEYDSIQRYIIQGQVVQLSYRYFSGESFDDFLGKPDKIDNVLRCKPDIVLTIFGANSIKGEVEKKVVLENCTEFFGLLRQRVDLLCPETIIVASQLPLRFAKDGNRFKTPNADEFKIFRDKVDKKLKSIKTIDRLMLIADPGRLDIKEYFKSDGVHFNPTGVAVHFDLILNFIGDYLQS